MHEVDVAICGSIEGRCDITISSAQSRVFYSKRRAISRVKEASDNLFAGVDYCIIKIVLKLVQVDFLYRVSIRLDREIRCKIFVFLISCEVHGI